MIQISHKEDAAPIYDVCVLLAFGMLPKKWKFVGENLRKILRYFHRLIVRDHVEHSKSSFKINS